MKDENVVLKSWKDKEHDKIILHQIKAPHNDSPETVKYIGVIGGISWPNNNSPGSCCAFGQLWDGEVQEMSQKKRMGTIKFFGECKHDAFSRNEFFTKITDLSTMYYVERFLTDMNEAEGYTEDFGRYVQEKGIKDPSPYLEQAPFADPKNFRYAIDVIEDWRNEGRIKIPEDTILFDELTTITREDLEQSPELKFPGINALRFVVGAYRKFNFAPVEIPYRRKKRSWMAM